MGNFFRVPVREVEKIAIVHVKFEYTRRDNYMHWVWVRLPPDVKTNDLPRHVPPELGLGQRQMGFRVSLDGNPLPVDRNYRIGELSDSILVSLRDDPVRVLSVRQMPVEQSAQAQQFI
jgi:hypothetical protein